MNGEGAERDGCLSVIVFPSAMSRSPEMVFGEAGRWVVDMSGGQFLTYITDPFTAHICRQNMPFVVEMFSNQQLFRSELTHLKFLALAWLGDLDELVDDGAEWIEPPLFAFLPVRELFVHRLHLYVFEEPELVAIDDEVGCLVEPETRDHVGLVQELSEGSARLDIKNRFLWNLSSTMP